MDLLDIIRKEVDLIPEGASLLGLRSVLRHIEAAYRHLARGQEQQDESAFTDAIYRTNQAFEGSIKEAYRVLAGKDPIQMSPFQIEKYLEENKVIRARVLNQLTNYRTQWRNPSTHDYNLDFDEDEAFLAIVSVSAFTKLLIDQIAEHAAYVAVRADVGSHQSNVVASLIKSEKLVDRLTGIFQDFLVQYGPASSAVPIERETQLLGALSGYLSSVAPDLKVEIERQITPSRPSRADMFIADQDELVIVELKGTRFPTRALENGLRQLESYMLNADATAGVLLLYSTEAEAYEATRRDVGREGVTVSIIRPADEKNKS